MSTKISRRSFLRGTTTVAAVAASTAAVADPRIPAWRGETRVEQIATNCEMCFWRCGVLAEVADGKVLKLQGNPHHPLTKGQLCARGNAGTELLYDPDRLKYPMMRTGRAGRREVQAGFLGRGAGSLCRPAEGTKAEVRSGKRWIPSARRGAGFFGTLMKAYGTPNVAEPAFAQCRGPREVGYALTFGRARDSPEPVDLEESKCIVLIGTHIGENVFTSQVTAFAEGLARGAKLIVVDPRFSTAASKADWWLPIRPGTDIALAAGLDECSDRRELYDKDYIDKYATGFPELRRT